MKKIQIRANALFVSGFELMAVGIILAISFLVSQIPGMANIGILLAGSAIGVISGGLATLFVFGFMWRKIKKRSDAINERELFEEDDWTI
jgi:hypothetical protein